MHGFRSYDNSAEREMSASVCTRCMPVSPLFSVTVNVTLVAHYIK